MHNLVPHFVLTQYHLGKQNGSFHAAALFVDISGFTVITETLMQYGTAGAETLANLMRSVFTPLIEGIYAHGGFIVGFAGDSFTAVFPSTHHAIKTQTPAVLRALAAAYIIQQTTAEDDQYETPYGSFEISSKIGVDIGQVEWGIICNESKTRATYYFRGTPIDGSSLAEHQANRGDLIVSAGVLAALRPLTAVTSQPINAYHRVIPPAQRPPSSPSDRFTPQFEVFGDLAAQFYPTDTLHQTHLGEFRQVINVFIGLEKNPTAADLEAFAQLVFMLQKTYGGLLNRIDFGDKGCNLLFFWGAPTAHENDVSRVLNFLLDLQAQSTMTFRAAVTYALAFSGFIGSDLREEFTCYGRGINLAARFLMQSEWGSIWVDSAIAQRATPQFSVDFIDQFPLKGFSTPQSAFALQAHRLQIAQSLFRGQMIGRELEISQIKQAIQPIWGGAFGGVVSIFGEAGLGKSRLVHEFVKSLANDDKHVSEGASQPRIFFCQTDEIIRQSLNPFRYFLRRFFNQHIANSEADNKSQFNTVLDNLIVEIAHLEEGKALGSELSRTRSFLGALVDLHWPDSLYAQLDSKLRFDNLLRALKILFIAESFRHPFIIQLEDSHWLDADSQTFITLLTRNVDTYPFALLTTSRPSEPGKMHFSQTLPSEVSCTNIHLAALDSEQIEAIAESVLTGQVADDLIDKIVRRAGGNPFFAEQILLYLKEQDLLVAHEKGWQLVDSQQDTLLPGDLRTVLVARLDRLSQPVRQVVQTAAVLGREFPLQLLTVMLSGVENVELKVETAVSAAIWISLTELRYLFKHGLMRDAAYEMQLHHQRRQLHIRAATSLETLHHDDLKPHYPDIAYHFEQGGAVDKAHIYLILAGNAAKDAYQNHQAINYYERALVLTPAQDIQTRFELLSSLEETLDLMGSRVEQKKVIGTLAELAVSLQKPDRHVRVALRQSRWAESTSDFELAVSSAKQAIHTAETTLPGMTGKRFVALGEIALGQAYLRLGNYAETEPRLLNALDILDEINDGKEVTNGRKVLASLYVYLGQYAKSEAYYQAALADYRASGDKYGEATVLGRLGLLARMQAKGENATAIFEEAIALQKQIGDRYGEGMARLNLGAVLQVQGNLPGAQNAFTQALFILHDIDHRVGEGAALNGMGWVARDAGDFAASTGAYEQALTILQTVGDRFGEAVTLANLGTVHHYQGNLDKAQKLLHQACDQQRELNDLRGLGLTLIYLGAVELTRGDIFAAKEAFQQTHEAMQQLGHEQHMIEATAGLARVALAEEDLPQAQTHAGTILGYLDKNPSLYGSVFPFRICMACYQALTAVNDPRSHSLLRDTMHTLQARADHFDDDAERDSFLTLVPDHFEVMQAWKAAGIKDKK